jgi:hypothetical protein
LGGFHRPVVFANPGIANRPFLANRAAFVGRPALFDNRFAVNRPFLVNQPAFINRSAFFNHRVAANRPFFFHRRHRFGGAFAAGLVSGAALGSFGYGSYGYGYPYYSTAAYDQDCYVVRRRILTRWGTAVIRDTLVCSDYGG